MRAAGTPPVSDRCPPRRARRGGRRRRSTWPGAASPAWRRRSRRSWTGCGCRSPRRWWRGTGTSRSPGRPSRRRSWRTAPPCRRRCGGCCPWWWSSGLLLLESDGAPKLGSDSHKSTTDYCYRSLVELIGQVRRLRVLTEVADRGSFSAAADALGLTQSAVSQHISALERAVGQTVVDRASRPAQLTEAGVILLRHARAVVARLDTAEQELAAVAGRRLGRLRLGAFPTALATFLPPVLARFQQQLPHGPAHRRGRAHAAPAHAAP